jgi:hypothetical protein
VTERLARVVSLLILSVLLVGTLWVVRYLPTNDGPEWVYLTHVQNHWDDPHTHYRAEYTPAVEFAARGFSTLYRPLEAWLGWERGLKVCLSAIVLGVAWGFVALVWACDRGRWALGLLGFPLALSWHLYMGFWAFVVGTGLGLFILALAVHKRELSGRARGALSLLLLVQAVAHVFSAVLTGGALLCLLVARAKTGKRARAMRDTLVMGIPAAAVLVASVVVGAGQGARMFTRLGFEQLPWRRALQLLPQILTPGPLDRALGVAGAVLVAMMLAISRVRRAETSKTDRAFGVAGVLLLLAGIFAPLQVPGWSFFSQRFLPLGVALVIAVVPIERASRRRLVSGALFAVAAGWLLLSYPFHERLAATVAESIAGLGAPIHRTRRQLPVPLATAETEAGALELREVPMLNPLLHMGALYAVVYGGTIPSVFTVNPAVHPLLRRPHDNEPEWVSTPERYWGAVGSPRFDGDLEYRHLILDELASLGVFYEGVVLFAVRPDDIALWDKRGYVTDWQSGGTFVGHFKACRIDVAVATPPAGATPSFNVTVGNYQLISDARPSPRVSADGITHFDLAPAPCGDVAVTSRWTASSDAPPLFCRNADPSGALHATVTRSSTEVTCDAPGRP